LLAVLEVTALAVVMVEVAVARVVIVHQLLVKVQVAVRPLNLLIQLLQELQSL
jgi:hypothetical protein